MFSQTGDILFHTESKIQTLEKPGYIVEHDASELLRSFQNVLHDVARTVNANNLNIISAGLATQRSSFIAMNAINFQPLTPVISWQDRRTHNDIKKYHAYTAEIQQLTGLVLNPHYGASKMAWCLNNIPEVEEALNHGTLLFAPLACFILNNILMEKPLIVDPANASRTLLMSLETCNWDKNLLRIFNISLACLPEIKSTESLYGHLLINNIKIPLWVCTGDQNATLFSDGTPKAKDIYINVGTGAFILNTLEKLPTNSQTGLLKSILYKSDTATLYAIEGTVNGAGRALQWLADKYNVQNYENNLEKWFKEYSHPPVFINGISGLGSPFWIADLESSFEFESSLERKFIAVAESIIFLIYVNVQIIQTESPLIAQINISGGLANNSSFCQRLADLCHIPVVRTTETEATAKGLFYLLCRHKINNIIQTTKNYEIFSPVNNPELNERFTRWKALLTTKISKKS